MDRQTLPLKHMGKREEGLKMAAVIFGKRGGMFTVLVRQLTDDTKVLFWTFCFRSTLLWGLVGEYTYLLFGFLFDTFCVLC